MDYFKSILTERKLDKCPLPLWTLRITDDEFEELRDVLEKCTHAENSDNPFASVCSESTLFFAEYWRRSYTGGPHSKRMVYDALNSTSGTDADRMSDMFYQAACQGAEKLGIEQYNGGRAERLNDMLYQGGLPMRLVTTESTDETSGAVWNNFTRGLVNRRIDFEHLRLGNVAANSRSMRGYCEEIIRGIDAEDCSLMPFWCRDEVNPWFVYLMELSRRERRRRHQQNPFSLSWRFRIDTIDKKIFAKYIVKGPKRLSDDFLNNNNLDNRSFFKIQVRKNGEPINTFEYSRNFCRIAVEYTSQYHNGDYISLYCQNQEEPFLGDSLDMSVPHLLYRNNNAEYEPGNRIGRMESLLLIPEGWTVEGHCGLPRDEFSYDGMKLLGIRIPIDFEDCVIVRGDDGKMSFGGDTAFYWTDIKSHPLYLPNVVEPLYDAVHSEFILCCDSEDRIRRRTRRFQFRNRWQQEWSDQPSYGEIFARVVDEEHYVTPIRFINIGEVDIALKQADELSCQIRIEWRHGSVSTQEGKSIGDGIWEINRNQCQDPGKIRFLFTPRDNNGRSQFYLSIKAPFKGFSIVDSEGQSIRSGSLIPYIDVVGCQYRYHIVGQERVTYRFGQVARELRWGENQLSIYEGERRLGAIPYEGDLLTLFQTDEGLQSLLERTARNILDAKVDVYFRLPGRGELRFSIKEYPYIPHQESEHVEIVDNEENSVDFRKTLKLIKLDDPDSKPIEMRYNSDVGCYILPEEIRGWGKTLLFGSTGGRVIPRLVDLTGTMDQAARVENRNKAIAEIQEKLCKSRIGDEFWERVCKWFEKVQEYGIPASSILELECVARDYKALLRMVFQLYVEYYGDESGDYLKGKLRNFSNDLGFQWYWLKPYLDVNLGILGLDSSPEYVQNKLYKMWVVSHKKEDEWMKYLGASEDIYNRCIAECINEMLESFKTWLRGLCKDSMVDGYDVAANDDIVKELAREIIDDEIHRYQERCENLVDNNQDTLDEEAEAFFKEYTEDGMPRNEAWLRSRVRAVAEHIRKNIDLFPLGDGIRKSIIYCCKSSNQLFLWSLNNELAYHKR